MNPQPNTMQIRDFVVLGRTVPEESKKYGMRVCMAGYSLQNNQFLRVYPLLVPVGGNAGANGFRARHVYDLKLQRNPNDTRTESWRVVDEKHPTETPWAAAAELKKSVVVNWLANRCVPSVKTLDDCKLSLGVVKVTSDNWEGRTVPRGQPDEDAADRTLFEDLDDQVAATPEFAADAVKFAPYIRFSDRDGSHKLQIREWGAYRLLSQALYADKPELLWGAPGYRTGKDLLLVLGNMLNHRKNWMVIKTFELEDAVPNLFDQINPDE